MNCNCIAKTEAQLKERVQKSLPAVIESVSCQAVAFTLSESSMRTAIVLPFSIKADAPGYRSQKGKTYMFHASFCPFCGTSTTPQAATT